MVDSIRIVIGLRLTRRPCVVATFFQFVRQLQVSNLRAFLALLLFLVAITNKMILIFFILNTLLNLDELSLVAIGPIRGSKRKLKQVELLILDLGVLVYEYVEFH